MRTSAFLRSLREKAADVDAACRTVGWVRQKDGPPPTGGTMMLRLMMLFTLASPFTLGVLAQPAERQPLAVFTQLGLTPKQVATIEEGRPVAKVLSWGNPSEVYVFGAVHVTGSPAAYLKAARDIERLARAPGYLGAGEIPATPTMADLRTLTLDADDIKALKGCREADCDLQLPSAAIQAFRDGINWSQPDVSDQVNKLSRERLIELIRSYQSGGNSALGAYRDKNTPARVSEQFETMIGRGEALPDVLPELRRYLLQYPEANLPSADSFFYWEKVDFGLKPTVRVNHGVIYNARAQNRDISVVAIKQLYASHYFHTALDLSMCVADAGPGPGGFYLLTLKGSEQEGLTGIKGSVLRKIVVDKTRSGLESALASIKKAVEQSGFQH
jgi:hypothetical protein